MATTQFQPPTASLRWSRFGGGIAWAAMVASIISAATETPFMLVFFVFFFGSLVTAAVGLAWLTLWAQRDNSLPGQFSIGSLLFATCFIAIFFAAVRWIGANLSHVRGAEGWMYLPIAMACGLAGLITVPIAFGMLDSMLRAANWSLKQPLVRSWLKRIWRWH